MVDIPADDASDRIAETLVHSDRPSESGRRWLPAMPARMAALSVNTAPIEATADRISVPYAFGGSPLIHAKP